MPGLAQPVTYETATAADGPRLAAWLLEQLGETPLSAFGEDFERRVRAWRRGDRANFWTLDRYLCRLGLMPFELPDDVWVAGAAQGGPR